MTRDYLTEKYELYGEEWQKNLLKRELNKIDNAESKEKALGQILWWGEYCENQTGNLSLKESESDKYSNKSQLYAELAALEEFNGMDKGC